MKCIECKELIDKKITYRNIFKVSKHHICEYCFTKYLYIQDLLVIPIENFQIYLNVLFDNYGNPLALMSFLKPYYLYYLKNESNKTLLYFDSFNEKTYTLVDELRIGDLYIITLKNESEKEIVYED